MTLVVIWKTTKGIGVIADSRFGNGGDTVSISGPKIFASTPVLNRARDGRKRRLPSMGFAFAGATPSGLVTNALASTCLQNLAAEDFDDGPTVQDVANLYERCGVLAIDDFRKWKAYDFCFEAVVFGRDGPSSPSRAFVLDFRIGDDGNAQCTSAEIDFSIHRMMLLGAGVDQVRDIFARAAPNEVLVPSKILQAVMDNPAVPSVGGYQQAALAAVDGVELHPSLASFWRKTPEGMETVLGPTERIIEFRLMGFELSKIGSVGRYSPTANHFAS
ncbi:hypothetical protein WBO78_09865 [Bosea sp. CCNWLW174]|uniref:hypothetical protein n=1 Tax=unclassified Bosea (in: a-proteobacteria) TaxID=2653178 RepID=UPI0030157FED